jgi:two-component system, repressor protein LuxO
MARLRKTILLVEDTLPMAKLYEEFLLQEGYTVVIEETGEGAITQLNDGPPDAVVLDLLLPDMNGLQVLQHARELYPELPIIVVTVTNSVAVAVEAMRHGAYDYIVKPFPAPRLTITVSNALERKALTAEVQEWRKLVGQDKFFNFIGQSPAMMAVYRVIEAVAPSKANVFIEGENGTGKEMAALAIHNASPRRNKPFVPLNCAAIPHDLMESTIFGHMKGAFTGAVSDQIGAAKAAQGGTLFLDEVCEMPPDLQAKLLRFAQTGELQAVGSNRAEFVDVRIISATNRDVAYEVASNRFREDLYYRLHVVPLEMPALRERGEDILMLASHFLARFSAEENKNFIGLSPEVMSVFRSYDWPGNVRQLENVLRNVVVLHNGSTVTQNMLPKDLKESADQHHQILAKDNVVPLSIVNSKPENAIKPLWIVEKNAILRALEMTGNDITRAAAMLEVSPSTLYRKLQAWRAPDDKQPQALTAL